MAGKKKFVHTYNDIISLENLCLAWQEFIVGKKSKPDVQILARDLMDNIVELHRDLVNRTYQHRPYESFFVNDPKRRHIHKASVRDRLLHHAIYRILYPFFDRTFIADSFSCRNGKGTHKAIKRFRAMAYQVSKNHTRTCWVLKCDIRKFFASIDHAILLNILGEYIPDEDVMELLEKVVESFWTEISRFARNDKVGLPLGNLTSQLFANVYLNEFDQWVKRALKANHYVRYADDFVFLSAEKLWLESIVSKVRNYLHEKLKLTLHPDKIFLKTLASGVDFLGWVHFADHRLMRRTTKNRMFFKINQNPTDESLQSYLGIIKHGNTERVRQELLGQFWLRSQ